MALGLLTLCALISGCYGAFTKTPADTNLFPRSTLRLNCASNIATPVAWYWYVADSNTRRTVFINDAIHPTYSAMFNIDRSDGGYDLVARSTADSSYCGLYQCVEDNGGIDSIANATVSVSTRPVCDVDKLNASASDYVTYSCNATSRCIGGSVPLVIQQDGTRRTAGNNLVHWKTEAGNIAFANITCSSVAVCPRVIVTGILLATMTTSSGAGAGAGNLDMDTVVIVGIVVVVVLIAAILAASVAGLAQSRRANNRASRPQSSQTGPAGRRQKTDMYRSSNTCNNYQNCGAVNRDLVFPVMSPYHHQNIYTYYSQHPSRNSCVSRSLYYYPPGYMVSQN